MNENDSSRPLLTVATPCSVQPLALPTSNARRGKRPILVLIMFLVLVYLSTVLYSLPLNRVLEARLCQEYYTRFDPSVLQPNGSVPEKLCKINEVQQQLAWLQGIMETTLIVCGECPCERTNSCIQITPSQVPPF